MDKTTEPDFAGHLSGRYYVDVANSDELAQGWILRELSVGLYLVTVFVRIGDAHESVLKVVHPLEMRGWLIFSTYEQARRHFDEQAIAFLLSIDLEAIRKNTCDELEDLVLAELKRAIKKGDVGDINRLGHFLKELGNSRI